MSTRKKGLIHRFLVFINTILAFLLLLAYLIPFIPPKISPILSALSLITPALIVLNGLFLAYWILRVRRTFLLPLIPLAIGFNHLSALYQFNPKEEKTADDLHLMSYNVRLFNRFEWIPKETIPQEIETFITEKNPDIISFQEYYATDKIDFPQYEHKFIKLRVQEVGQAIYSKYPIIHSGSLDFPKTTNNVIYADIVKDKDTLRIVNMHLQSLGLSKDDVDITTMEKEKGKRLLSTIGNSYRVQQEQLEELSSLLKETPHPVILSGDINNTAFSYTYRQLMKNGRKDAFKEAGKGLGQTFLLEFIPLRIDMFIVDSAIKVNQFKTYSEQLSDHYPISSWIDLNSSANPSE